VIEFIVGQFHAGQPREVRNIVAGECGHGLQSTDADVGG